MNKNTSGWSNFNNVDRNNDYFIFKISEAHVLSPTFVIPDSINVNATLGVYAYHTNIFVSYSPVIYVKGSSTPVKEGTSMTISGGTDIVETAGCSNKIFATSMSKSASNISIYVSGNKNGVDFPKFFINYCKIAYR